METIAVNAVNHFRAAQRAAHLCSSLTETRFEAALADAGVDHLFVKFAAGYAGAAYTTVNDRRRLARLLFDRGSAPAVLLGRDEFSLADVTDTALPAWRLRARTIGADPDFFTLLERAIRLWS